MPPPVVRTLGRRALGMGDAASGGHQVHGAGRDLERVAFAVAMHDAAVEQIGDGRQPDVRMRAHVHAPPRHELHRPHLIEEDEGTDHLALAVRQRAAHGKAVAEIAHARNDNQFERVARALVAEHRVLVGHPAHVCGLPIALRAARAARPARCSFTPSMYDKGNRNCQWSDRDLGVLSVLISPPSLTSVALLLGLSLFLGLAFEDFFAAR
jgi:hypothetical protein